MHYLDASVAVALIAREPRSEQAWRLLKQHDKNIAASHWTSTEVVSALSIKVRTREIDMIVRADAEREWRKLTGTGLILIDVTRSDFQLAADYLSRPELKLRAGDALHLAVARTNDCALLTFDERMADAAAIIGIAVIS